MTAKRTHRMDSLTREAIARACRYMKDDRKIIQLCTAPHEGVTVEDVQRIRSGEIPPGFTRPPIGRRNFYSETYALKGKTDEGMFEEDRKRRDRDKQGSRDMADALERIGRVAHG